MSLSHLIASLHRDRPPPRSQKTAKIWWLQRFTGKGTGGCSPGGGTATVCRALPTQASPAQSPSDHSNSRRCFCTPKNPKLTLAATSCVPPLPPAACRATLLVPLR